MRMTDGGQGFGKKNTTWAWRYLCPQPPKQKLEIVFAKPQASGILTTGRIPRRPCPPYVTGIALLAQRLNEKR